jgi:uncharacterized RDD family membrane protein YckC
MAEPSGPRASFFSRLAAAILDAIVVLVINTVVGLVIGRGIASLVAIAVGIAYYGYLEGSESGQTLGKKALGIQVRDLRTGGAIGFSRGVIRYFGRILSAIPLLLGYFWMLWDSEKQTWHDKLAGAVVVPAGSAASAQV